MPDEAGTLKCRAGYRHFLVRGFNKVRGEWSLMALCYNFTRVLNILGFERFLAAVAKSSCPASTGKTPKPAFCPILFLPRSRSPSAAPQIACA